MRAAFEGNTTDRLGRIDGRPETRVLSRNFVGQVARETRQT